MTEAARTIAPAPVRKSLVVAAPPETAFAVFTARMGRWWPPSHSINAAPLADVVIEPFAGGRWYERGADGSTAPWGEVLDWAPPYRLVLAWRLDATWTYQPALETIVEVTFTPDGAGTRVDLEHRHLERYAAAVETAREALDGPRGWGGLLALFGAACVEASVSGLD
ncbi:MAG: SRPBCC family protein [Alphaproteobacteria bacterium]|nr:SRPBCC family protein [Alphaproteobacteria bacterium]